MFSPSFRQSLKQQFFIPFDSMNLINGGLIVFMDPGYHQLVLAACSKRWNITYQAGDQSSSPLQVKLSQSLFFSGRKVPIAIINRIECAIRSFLWSHGEENRKLHLVGWRQVIKPKTEGGLGIPNLKLMQ